MSRGVQWTQQTCIESVIQRLFAEITQKRHYNFFKLVPVPLKIEVQDTKEFEIEDLAALIDVENKFHPPTPKKSNHKLLLI